MLCPGQSGDVLESIILPNPIYHLDEACTMYVPGTYNAGMLYIPENSAHCSIHNFVKVLVKSNN